MRFSSLFVCPPTVAGGAEQDDGPPFSSGDAAGPEGGTPPLSLGGDVGGRRISWEKPLEASPTSPPGSPGTAGAVGGGSGGSSREPGGGRSSNGSGGGRGGAEESESGGGGGDGLGNSRARKSGTPTALGWSEGFDSSPEVQMQALAEVGRLVRAAARKGRGDTRCEEEGTWKRWTVCMLYRRAASHTPAPLVSALPTIFPVWRAVLDYEWREQDA